MARTPATSILASEVERFDPWIAVAYADWFVEQIPTISSVNPTDYIIRNPTVCSIIG